MSPILPSLLFNEYKPPFSSSLTQANTRKKEKREKEQRRAEEKEKEARIESSSPSSCIIVEEGERNYGRCYPKPEEELHSFFFLIFSTFFYWVRTSSFYILLFLPQFESSILIELQFLCLVTKPFKFSPLQEVFDSR
ncbi:uncharacterized protein DS421_18g621970 [Arachis hypogaea]|nr:uncharacterized protein DS421_18g621970 [Arachis hypogaea]